MSFDWLRFLSARNVPFVTSGPNVSTGSVAIKCPMCGHADPSEHLVIRLNGKGWFCWRNKAHRGGSPVRLVMLILRCSYEEAAHITGTRSPALEGDFMEGMKSLLGRKAPEAPKHRLRMPDHFKPLRDIYSARQYITYLHTDRGIAYEDIWQATERFDVRYCNQGSYRRRIIFPVYFEGKLATWTGRAIDGNATIRYRTLSQDKEKADREGYPPALGPVTDYLLWYDDLLESDCHTIIICEGPMDALKVRLLGEEHGITATCCFTSQPTDPQIDLLHSILPRFERRCICLDRGSRVLALQVRAALGALKPEKLELPPDLKDPGELNTTRALKKLLATPHQRTLASRSY